LSSVVSIRRLVAEHLNLDGRVVAVAAQNVQVGVTGTPMAGVCDLG
jgi:hypothetical protein